MSDLMLSAVLNMPLPDDPSQMDVLTWMQFRDRARQSADELDRLRAENERLREAIRPFADCVYNDNGDVTIDTSHLKTGAWVMIRAALAKDAGE